MKENMRIRLELIDIFILKVRFILGHDFVDILS